MSLDINAPTPQPHRRTDGDGSYPPAEARTWEADETTRSEALANPHLDLRLPRGERMTIVIDRVRAKPAVEPTMSFALGQNAIGLGVWGTFFPRSVNRFLGMNARPGLIRLVFGMREFATGLALTGDPTRKDALWSRVAGDVFDIAVLASLARAGNPKRGNARLALGVVLAVTAADVFAAWRMSTVQRNCR